MILQTAEFSFENPHIKIPNQIVELRALFIPYKTDKRLPRF